MSGGKTRTGFVAAIFAGCLLLNVELSAQYPSHVAQLPMVVPAPMLAPAPPSTSAGPRDVPRGRRAGLLTGLFTSKTRPAIKQVNFTAPLSSQPSCSSCGAPPKSCDCSAGGVLGNVLRAAGPSPGCVGGVSEFLGCGNITDGGLGCGSGNDVACPGGCGARSCAQRVRLYGEYLYLRPRNAEVPYAVPIDGPIAPVLGNGIQIGPTVLVDMDYESGFRAGFNLALNDGAQIGARFTNFESRTSDQAFIQPPDVLRSLVAHPLGNNVAVDSLRASARYDVDFELVDLSYQAHCKCTQRMTLDYVLGIRYGELGQEFRAQFETNGVTSVDTDVDFHGTGPRIGLDLQRNVGQLGLFLYSRGDAAFLAGKSRARYNQSDVFAGTIVDTSWESGRIVTQLDFELGFGWADGKAIRVSAGYLISSWFNAVRTDEFIQSVRTNRFGGLGDGITFDGLVVHGELRF